MTAIQKLPFQLAPYANESFLGYTARVAEANYFRSMRGMHIALGLEGKGMLPKLSSAAERSADIAQVLGARPDELGAMLPKAIAADGTEVLIHGLELKDHHILRNVRRVAPAGLRQQPYHRFAWQLFDLPFCTQTWEMVIEECPSPECRHGLTWRSPLGAHICENCGFDLRHAEARKIEEADRYHLQLYADLVSTDPLENQRAILPLSPDLRQFNRGALIQLAALFGKAEAAFRGNPVLPENRCLLTYPSIQARGAELLKRYPHSLHELMADDLEGPTPQLIIKLKAMYTSALTAEPKAFVAKMIADMSAGRRPGVRGLADRRREINAMTTRAAAAQLGIDNASVRRLVKNGHLTPTPIKGESRQIDWFSPEDVNRLSVQLQDKIGPDEITGRYGIPQHALDQFVQNDVLRWHPSPALSECFLGAFMMRSEVEAFIAQLNSIVREDDETTPRVPLSEVFAAAGPSPKPWAPIFEMARVGALPGGICQVDPAKGFAAKNLLVEVGLLVNVLRGQVPWLLQAEPSRHYCSQIEIEERLAIFPRDTSALIRAGVLKPVLPGSPKISRVSLLEAASEFISSTEIAARIGLSPPDIAKWARRRALEKPNTLPMFSRQAVEPFLPPMPLKFLRAESEEGQINRGDSGHVSPSENVASPPVPLGADFPGAPSNLQNVAAGGRGSGVGYTEWGSGNLNVA